MSFEVSTGEGWSLRRLRERVLRVAGRVLVHGRRAVLVVAATVAPLWNALWRRLGRLSEIAAAPRSEGAPAPG